MAKPKKYPYVTQNDIARLANVSQSAVGAALGRTTGNKIRISPETREKVLRAADQLNYMPNRAASITRSGRTREVSIIISGTMLQTSFLRLKHLAHALAAKGFSVTPQELQWTGHSLEQAWDEALAARAEGIVLASSFGIMQPSLHRKLLNSPVPVISLCGPAVQGIPLVAPDLGAAFHEITQQLLQTGRRRLFYAMRFRQPDAIEQIGWKRTERRDGFLRAVNDFDAQSSCEVVEVFNDQPSSSENEHRLGMIAVNEVLRRTSGQPPDAILCANDNFAHGALTAAHQAGINIPQQMEITGCDGEAWTGFGATPITTIEQPTEALSQKAADLLLKMLDGQTVTESHFHLPCEIRWRASCRREIAP